MRGLSSYQGKPNGGQKFRSNCDGKYILFQKKGIPSQQQPNFASCFKMCPSREDRGISPSLETTNKRSRALGFSRRLPNSSSNGTSTGEDSTSTKVKSGITKTSRSGSEGNAGKGLHSKVCHSKGEFLRRNRPVINLKDLNLFIPYKHFKMEDLHCLKYLLQIGGYICKIDLKHGYFSVPLHKDLRKLVRFFWAGNLYEFLCLYFGLGPAPRIVTKLLKVPVSVLRRLMIRVIIYLEDLLILGNSMSEIFMARDSVIFLLQHLGFAINLKKCVLDIAQKIEFLGLIVNSQTMTLSLLKR